MMKRLLPILMFLSALPAFGQTNPYCTVFRQTGQTLPAGLFRICVGSTGNDQISIERANDAAGAFGSTINIMSATSGTVTFPQGGVTVGVSGSTGGIINYAGATSGQVSVKAAAAAGTWTWTWPTSGGTNGYVLTTNGAGVTSWNAAAAPSTETRLIMNQAALITNTGAPVTVVVGTSAVAEQFPNGADSSAVVQRFVVPPDATASQTLTLEFGYNADSAPGTTNNKFTFKIACTKNGTDGGYTSTDTITASNDTLPHTFVGTNTTCASVSAGDLLSVVIYRVTGGANDAAVPIDIEPIAFRYTSVQ